MYYLKVGAFVGIISGFGLLMYLNFLQMLRSTQRLKRLELAETWTSNLCGYTLIWDWQHEDGTVVMSDEGYVCCIGTEPSELTELPKNWIIL